MAINPKMQPKLKSSHRAWQHFHQGDYYYGECPKCGHVSQPEDEGYSVNDPDVQIEYCVCEECGTEFYIETATVYRYGGLIESNE